MVLSDLSIRRPVLTTVATAAVVLIGWVSYRTLAVRELPDVDFPIVSVQTVLPGASPEVVETEVTEVLEDEINTIEGLKTLTSISGEQASVITAEFQLSRNIDAALQDVRDKVSRVRGNLPTDVDEPVIQKLDPEASPIIWLALTNPDVSLTQIDDIADNVIKDRIQTLPGVGAVTFGGAKRFAVRVRLDARRLAAFGLTVGDVRAALQRGNVEIPSGRIEGETREFTVRTEGELPTPEAFNGLIVAWQDDTPIHLGEVGIAEPGVEDERTLARYNGEPTVGLGIIKQSDANTVEVSRVVMREVERIRRDLPPGYTLHVAVDNSRFIERSLEEVRNTLLVAFGLVVFVIMLFLRSGRATLIPSIAIPVSIVGTFAALALLGFSINTLTLLALTLAIGIVVDDAIVVVENVYRHMEEGEDPVEAARNGTSEIAFAVIAISITLVIVFLPIAFMGGITGRLFREFGIGVAAAVLISALVALTLTPMLCSRFLRLGLSQVWIFQAMERWLERLTALYRRILTWAMGRRGRIGWGALAVLVVSVGVMSQLGREFVPPEDRGEFLALIHAPEGSTLEYTDAYLKRFERIVKETKGVDGFFSAIGLSLGKPASVTDAILFARLADHRDRDAFAIMNEVRRKVRSLPGVDVFIIAPSALASGFQKPLEFVMQSRDLARLATVSDSMLRRARQIPGLSGVDTDLDLNKPELTVRVDRARAAAFGLSVADVASTLQILFGSQDVTRYKRGSKRYDVIVQLQNKFRATPGDLSSVYVRGTTGKLVQLASVVTVKEGVGPNQINHYGRQRSVILDANLAGVSLGDALERVRAVAREVLPADFSTALAGQSRDLEESSSSLTFSLIMALVAIYLVLAGQFESFVHPLTIMLALPLALFGAVVSLGALGMTLNIYSFIGIIMLMGLVTKNSILLVDYTLVLRRRGVERSEAVIRAGVVRLRPILMTAISVVFGVLPIAIGLGAGSESRRPLGVVVVGGMVASTTLTLVVVPVFYILLEDGLAWIRARAAAAWPGRTAVAGTRDDVAGV